MTDNGLERFGTQRASMSACYREILRELDRPRNTHADLFVTTRHCPDTRDFVHVGPCEHDHRSFATSSRNGSSVLRSALHVPPAVVACDRVESRPAGRSASRSPGSVRTLQCAARAAFLNEVRKDMRFRAKTAEIRASSQSRKENSDFCVEKVLPFARRNPIVSTSHRTNP